MIDVVSATRLDEKAFGDSAPLGLSLRRLARDRRLVPRIAFANSAPLADVYNARIEAADAAEILAFIHDDVWIDDHFFADHVAQGLERYDVIGVAGNRRRIERQPAWAFADEKFTWDARENLSGAVAHGPRPFGPVSFYGPVPAACELLDGVFLAARRETLVKNGALFDRRFDFHCYDLDFCRAARAKGLTLGTWPVALTHRSGGAFGTDAWKARFAEYLRKWGG